MQDWEPKLMTRQSADDDYLVGEHRRAVKQSREASRLLLQALEREGPDPYAFPGTRLQPFVSPRAKVALQ
jgi:hypothetical protein